MEEFKFNVEAVEDFKTKIQSLYNDGKQSIDAMSAEFKTLPADCIGQYVVEYNKEVPSIFTSGQSTVFDELEKLIDIIRKAQEAFERQDKEHANKIDGLTTLPYIDLEGSEVKSTKLGDE